MKTTYILGAGASYGTIPTVKYFPGALMQFAQDIRAMEIDEVNPFVLNPEHLAEQYNHIAQESIDAGTLDLYAKELYDSGRKDEKGISFLYLKALLSVYFTVIQLHRPVEKRLRPFLNTLREHIQIVGSEAESSINFISWNYDFQLELALGRTFKQEVYNPSDVLELIPTLGVQPTNAAIEKGGRFKSLQILHMNGIAGMYAYRSSKQEETGTMLRPDSVDISMMKGNVPLAWQNCFRHAYGYLDAYSRREISFENYFNFHWEREKHVYQDDLERRAMALLEESDRIIIIGYSFPGENRTFDDKWLKELGGKKQVILQDPTPKAKTLQLLKQHFQDLEEETEVEELYVPRDLMPS